MFFGLQIHFGCAYFEQLYLVCRDSLFGTNVILTSSSKPMKSGDEMILRILPEKWKGKLRKKSWNILVTYFFHIPKANLIGFVGGVGK